jgi:phage gp16-like protein
MRGNMMVELRKKILLYWKQKEKNNLLGDPHEK